MHTKLVYVFVQMTFTLVPLRNDTFWHIIYIYIYIYHIAATVCSWIQIHTLPLIAGRQIPGTMATTDWVQQVKDIKTISQILEFAVHRMQLCSRIVNGAWNGIYDS